MNLFRKILIANRGEIAVRIIKSAQILNIETLAIFTDDEHESLHVKNADNAISLGSGELSETYLNIDKIINIANENQCDAIHPGYGFLAENPLFVEACENANITFIGPSAYAMRIMGNKIAARDFINKINIPTTKGIVGDIETLKTESATIPFPVLIKAASGGGGKGMRIVHHHEDLNQALEATSREAKNYFGNDAIFIEQFIENPRHIEIQILSDHYGNHIHLYERECSLQRRYQKIIEESPSSTLTPKVRADMGQTAVKIAKEIGYKNAGTIEFLVDQDLNYYFLEMNTRVQVEHPVTEMVTGVDIVKEQILIAAGNKLSLNQHEVKQTGHAIESRIYAEDPENNFLPSPGTMNYYNEPIGKNIRIDTAIEKACTIESAFDPMISKLIVWETTRELAIKKSIAALNNYAIHGIKTNIEFLLTLLKNQDYLENKISTKYIETNFEKLQKESHQHLAELSNQVVAVGIIIYSFSQVKSKTSIWNSLGYWRESMQFEVKVNNRVIEVVIDSIHKKCIQLQVDNQGYIVEKWTFEDGKISFFLNKQMQHLFASKNSEGKTNISFKGYNFTGYRKDILRDIDFAKSMKGSNGETSNQIFSPMPGKVIKINVSAGDAIKKGDILLIVEAMKMENNILAEKDAIIKKITTKLNDMVNSQQPLIVLE